MKTVIAAGGTGGHIYPGIALAEELLSRDKDNKVLFLGSREGLESELIPKEGYPIEFIRARGLLRKLSYKAISAPFVSFLGFFDSLKILKGYRPDVLISTGGYVSLPACLAAYTLRIPILIHEENSIPGVVNRICSRLARWRTLSFKETAQYMQGVLTGNPVRRRILKVKRVFGQRTRVLVLGGSQGALSINRAVPEMLEEFKALGLELHHITGERDYRSIAKEGYPVKYPFYHLSPYMYNIEEGLASSDLVVSRAGATAISEILALGLPSVLVPFPYSAEDHQRINAEILSRQGAAVVLENSRLKELPGVIKELIGDRQRLKDMGKAAQDLAKREAAKKIVDLIYEHT